MGIVKETQKIWQEVGWMELNRIRCLANLTKVRQETCKNSLLPDLPETPGGEKVSSRTKMSKKRRAAGAWFQSGTVFNNPSSSILQACTYLPYFATTQCYHCNHHRLTSLCTLWERLEIFGMCAAISSKWTQPRTTIRLAGFTHQLALHLFSLVLFLQRSLYSAMLIDVNSDLGKQKPFIRYNISLYCSPVVHLTVRKLYSKMQKNRNLEVFLRSLPTFLHVKVVLVSTPTSLMLAA